MPARYKAADYVGALQRLLPRGRVWSRENDTAQTQVLSCFAPAFETVDAAAADLLTDAFPTTTFNLLEEWEASLGLPDPCLGADPTLQQRQNQVIARFTDGGGQSAQRFIDFAARLGMHIFITDYAPFRAGRSRAGSPAMGASWASAWTVTIVSSEGSFLAAAFRAGQGVAGQPLNIAPAALTALACELRRIMPAHTVLYASSGDFNFITDGGSLLLDDGFVLVEG